MPNRYSKKIAYQDNDIQRLTEKHIQYMREMHEQYEIPEFVKLQWLAARKNVQVAFFASPLKKWEQVSINEFGKKHPFQEYKNSIVDIIRKTTVPKLEAYYQCAISAYYLFDSKVDATSLYNFSVKIFTSSLFKVVNAHQIAEEGKLATRLSQKIRENFGRGAKQVSTYILRPHVLLFIISDLSPASMPLYLEKNSSSREIWCEMLQETMSQYIENIVNEEYHCSSEVFAEVDWENNKVILLALLEDSLAKGDLD